MHRPKNNIAMRKALKETLRTPELIWDCLIKQFPDLVKGDCLDPSAGHGELMLKLVKHNPDNHHMVVDVRKQELREWYKNGLMDKIGQMNCWVDDYLDRPIHKKFNTIISNPPFSITREFVEKSLQHIYPDGHVIFLHRLNWLGTQDRSLWHMEKPLKHVIIITKRPIFVRDDVKKNIADVYEYCMMIWQKSFKGDPTVKWLITHDVPFETRQTDKKEEFNKGFFLRLAGKKEKSFHLRIGKFRR
jgi:hypothetical protein